MILSAAKNKLLVIMYDTLDNEAGYITVDVVGQAGAELIGKTICDDGFYKNDVTDLYSVYQQLIKTLT